MRHLTRNTGDEKLHTARLNLMMARDKPKDMAQGHTTNKIIWRIN